MSESEILALFRGVTLEDTSGKLKEDNTSSSTSGGELKLKKKKKKKEEVVKKLSVSGGVVKKKKSNNVGVLEEQRKVRMVNMWNEGRGKVLGKMYYGVGRSVLGTMFFAEITHPDGRLLRLGTFKSERLAALAYDQAALQIYGLQATLNFPANNN